ncbi:MAG: tetratricopeptide repeat protein [Gemmatimonadota bacterium]
MSDPLEKPHGFLAELKRRKVYRVAIAYVAVTFVGLEAVDLLIPATTLPAWSGTFFLAIVIIGFPVALVVAWAFELTPEGVRKTPSVGQEGEPTASPERRNRLTAIATLGLLAVAAAAGWYVVGRGGGSEEEDISDRSIAVLPFETLGSQETTPFTDGVHVDLLTRLSHVSDLSVISRTSVMQYRSPAKSLRAIAAELGVAWVVRGEVQEAGDQVQVNARLVNARTDRQVWAESYRRQLTAANLFEIQAEITRQIARALETHLSPREELQVRRTPTESLDAYRLYTQGRELLDRRTEDAMGRALDYFQRAIADDSSYALAWVGVADALSLMHAYAVADSFLPRAESAVLRALELDPESAEAHASLGLLYSLRFDGPAAIRELTRSVELRPGYAEAHSWLAWVHQLLGHPEEALESAKRGVELDPLSPEAIGNLSLAYLGIGEPEKALEEARRIHEIQASWATASFQEGVSLYRLGRFTEATAILEDLVVPWTGSGLLATLALIHVASGDTTEARTLLAQLEEQNRPFAAGLVHVALGEVDQAFDAFQTIDAWSEWPSLAVRSFYGDLWGPLRDDPRYEELVREVDRYWGQEGSDVRPPR